MNGWMARTTLEMLGQAGLGYSFDNFFEDSTDAYGESIKMFLYAQSLIHRQNKTNVVVFAPTDELRLAREGRPDPA